MDADLPPPPAPAQAQGDALLTELITTAAVEALQTKTVQQTTADIARDAVAKTLQNPLLPARVAQLLAHSLQTPEADALAAARMQYMLRSERWVQARAEAIARRNIPYQKQSFGHAMRKGMQSAGARAALKSNASALALREEVGVRKAARAFIKWVESPAARDKTAAAMARAAHDSLESESKFNDARGMLLRHIMSAAAEREAAVLDASAAHSYLTAMPSSGDSVPGAEEDDDEDEVVDGSWGAPGVDDGVAGLSEAAAESSGGPVGMSSPGDLGLDDVDLEEEDEEDWDSWAGPVVDSPRVGPAPVSWDLAVDSGQPIVGPPESSSSCESSLASSSSASSSSSEDIVWDYLVAGGGECRP